MVKKPGKFARKRAYKKALSITLPGERAQGRDFGLSVMSGAILLLAFPKFDVEAVAWLALVPLLHCLRGKGVGSAFLLGWICGLTFFAGQLYWLVSTLKVYGHISTLVSFLSMVALVVYLSLYFALFAGLLSMFEKKLGTRSWLTVPLLWTSLEYLRENAFFLGFPWGSLGYSQYESLTLIQVADITGVPGVTFAVAMVNAAATYFIFCLTPQPFSLTTIRKALLAPIAVIAGVLVGLYSYGSWRLDRVEQQVRGLNKIRVAVVQGNISQERKWDEENDVPTLDKYKRLTLEASTRKPRLTIWPETAVPFFFQTESEGREEVLRIARQGKAYMLFGSPSYDYSREQARYYNSAFLVSPQGEELGKYNKRRLVPFGEYVPLKRLFFFVNKIVEGEGEFSEGGNQQLLSVAGAPIGMLICFEVLFPGLARGQVRRGARLLVNITNDAWFGRTSAPYEHFSIGVFRAIENRVAVVRAANTGISGFIAPSGRVLKRTEIFQDAWLAEDVALAQATATTFNRFGSLFAWGTAAFTIILSFLVLKRE